MKNQWRIVLGLVLTLIIVIFASLNNQQVAINFGVTAIKAPLIIVIIGSAFIGAVVIALVATSSHMKQTKQIKELREQQLTDDASVEQRIAERKAELEREYANKAVEMQQTANQTGRSTNASFGEQHSSNSSESE
ncbi:LapA family protein [Enterococcus camelliae]|uniref:Lipopolysaccharide assembly LapA domain-containing protein n=1 Tax=Enterococcus camelliae TaxID=453959 RepID=A0ABW5TIE3_9ENTE